MIKRIGERFDRITNTHQLWGRQTGSSSHFFVLDPFIRGRIECGNPKNLRQEYEFMLSSNHQSMMMGITKSSLKSPGKLLSERIAPRRLFQPLLTVRFCSKPRKKKRAAHEGNWHETHFGTRHLAILIELTAMSGLWSKIAG